MESMEFLMPGEPVDNELPNMDSADMKCNFTSLFLMSSNPDAEETPLKTLKTQSVPFKQKRSVVDLNSGSAPLLKSREDLYGLSLNERLLGRRIEKSATEVFASEFPSFELIELDTTAPGISSNKTTQNSRMVNNGKGSIQFPLDQQGGQMFVGANEVLANKDKETMGQKIFATAFEHEFYNTLISSSPQYSPRIFEIEKVWVDQRTLTLSMRPGGWIHPNVMDAFGKMVMTSAYWRDKEGKSAQNDILMHVVIKDVTKILMNPKLNHSDPSYKHLFCPNNIGFRLENAGLVHIPCQQEKQWVLIVANFIDKCFDVLNSDYCDEKFSSVIETVISNFKILFVNDYPHDRNFKIKEFPIRHVKVPKHNFRYDSGIFVIQYILSFDGIQVKHFSNDDIQSLREKFTTLLVLNKHNEHQIPVVKNFLRRIAPNMVR